MPLPSTQTVAVPARSYAQWGVVRVEITADTATGRIDTGVVLRRCNEAEWSDRPEDTVYVRATDMAGYLLTLPDAADAIATLQAAQAALLSLAGRLMDRDGVR